MSLFEKLLLIGLVWAVPPGLWAVLLAADDRVNEAVRAATVSIVVFIVFALTGASLTIINQ